MSDKRDALAVWVTVSELAKMRGVDKSAISRRVARFEAEGLLTTRRGPNRTKLVSPAEFTRVADETVDAVRAFNGAAGAASDGEPADPLLRHAQARNAALQADLRQLELDERTSKLVPRELILTGADMICDAILDTCTEMVDEAEELATAVARGGLAGAVAFLKTVENRLRDRIADAARALAAETGAGGAPEPAMNKPGIEGRA